MSALAREPFATMPWWKSLQVMNENKGVFGLNMLGWWDKEGTINRIVEPMLPALESGELDPVVAEAFSFADAPATRTDSSPSARTSARSFSFPDALSGRLRFAV